jgi:hypothetical protein
LGKQLLLFQSGVASSPGWAGFWSGKQTPLTQTASLVSDFADIAPADIALAVTNNAIHWFFIYRSSFVFVASRKESAVLFFLNDAGVLPFIIFAALLWSFRVVRRLALASLLIELQRRVATQEESPDGEDRSTPFPAFFM